MNTDSKAEIDLLDRSGFAKEISKGIINSAVKESNGFVVGLTGKWGSGKSTLLDFIKRNLKEITAEKEIDCAFIDFNPWMFTDEENIKKAFLTYLAKGIQPKKNWKPSPTRVKRFLSNALKITKVGKVVGGELGNNISGLLEKYLKNDTSLSIKSEIDNTLVKLNKKIFVFIDDIDRLFPKQVFEILQVLKLSGNFKNTYYIIAFDREAVEICIESQFKEYGKKYLDKIIQADFLIPEIPSEAIERIFFDNLEEFLKENEIQYNISDFMSVWSYRLFKKYFATLRDVYRYFNSLKFRLPPINKDINVTDFLILEGIRLYDFPAYELIYKEYSSQVLSLESSSMNSPAILEKFESKQTKKLVEFLFEGNIYTNSLKGINAKRLCDIEYFERYFALKISNADIGESDIRIIMEVKSNRVEKLNTLSEDRLKNLCRRMKDNNLLEFYHGWDFDLINDLFTFFDKYSNKAESINVLLSDAIINLLVIDENKRTDYCEKFIRHLMLDFGVTSVAREYFCHYILLTEEKDTGFAYQYYYFKEYYRNHIPAIRKFYLNYLDHWKNQYLQGVISNSSSFFTLLFVYDFAAYKKEDYLALILDILTHEKNLLFYLKSVLSINSLDDKPYKINYEVLNLFLPSEYRQNFIDRLKKINNTMISAKQNEQREFFLKYINTG